MHLVTILILVIVSLFGTDAAEEETLIASKDIQPRIEFAGEINGKSFYYSNDQRMQKGDAGAYCSSNGMELARFDSTTESNFLIGRLPTSDRYWTSAFGTNYLPSHFTWVPNTVPIPTSMPMRGFVNSMPGLTLYPNELRLTQTNVLSYYWPLCFTSSKNELKHKNQLAQIHSKEPDEKIPEKIIRVHAQDGPISMIDNMTPRFIYIGEINGKHFYYGDTFVRQAGYYASEAYCENLGMNLASFSTIAESDFVWDGIPTDYFWTSGIQKLGLEYFLWGNEQQIPDHPFTYYQSSNAGLTFNGQTGVYTKHLFIANPNDNFRPICVFIP